MSLQSKQLSDNELINLTDPLQVVHSWPRDS